MRNIYIARLSHENHSLAFSEFKSILLSEEIPFNLEFKVDEFVIFESFRQALDILVKRAGLVLELGEFIDIISTDSGNVLNEILKIIRDYLSSDRFCLEVDSVKGFGKSLCKSIVESIGARNICTRKKTSSGSNILKISFIANVALIYRMVYRRRKKIYESREPHRRPIYRPGTMKPVLARVFVNLSKVSSLKHEVVLDPFCGVGGFAIEACLMGLNTICCDIDKSMVLGAKLNVESFGCSSSVEIMQMDAGFQGLASSRVDGIATDPPYGIQSIPRGIDRSLLNLLSKFIENSYHVLRKKRYAVFATPIQLSREVDIILRKSGFEILEKHLDKVHSSLTRVIYVVKKFD
ncbi:MAG: RsmD family RNA methyltransferase [Desulfurococcaceae archaeon]|nr:RsmD family RNA methyltransferase [Desulfurococcaceae archaeon]